MTNADVPMEREFQDRVAGCAFAWSRDPTVYPEHRLALWRWHREAVAKAEAAARADYCRDCTQMDCPHAW